MAKVVHFSPSNCPLVADPGMLTHRHTRTRDGVRTGISPDWCLSFGKTRSAVGLTHLELVSPLRMQIELDTTKSLSNLIRNGLSEDSFTTRQSEVMRKSVAVFATTCY